VLQSCRQCSSSFEVTPDDLAFLEKISPVFHGKKELLPSPTLCSQCRHQRRFAFRDERKLYRRKCDASEKDIISIYSPDKPFKVYASDIWWGDSWDPMTYGRDFDFQRPFFVQWKELSVAVPKLQYSEYANENCPYNNRICNAKDCYMCFNLDGSRNAYYCEIGHGLTDCVDCMSSRELENCDNCLTCQHCYGGSFLWSCTNSSDSSFCFDCQGCSDCLFCWNLRNKQYCIWNTQYTKEEYERRKAELKLFNWSAMSRAWEEFVNRKTAEALHRHADIFQSEQCTGTAIFESKNCTECFEVLRGQDLMRAINVDNVARDCRDANNINERSELIYESMSTSQSHVLFSLNTWESSDILYSELCKNCSSLFGCSGLKHKQYCILNKQFTKEGYETLVPKIIEHMRRGEEWGEFFPVEFSPLAYNEAQAQERFPMTQEAVLRRGWTWREECDEPPVVLRIVDASQLPDAVDDIPDDILNWAIRCEVTGRPFRLIAQELAFYRQRRLPIPRMHPDERHRRRLLLQPPWKLWKRNCMKCRKPIETTYAPERPEIVYCGECYLKEVY